MSHDTESHLTHLTLLTMTTSPLLLVVSLCPDGKLRRGGGGGGDLESFSVRYRGTVNSPNQSVHTNNIHKHTWTKCYINKTNIVFILDWVAEAPVSLETLCEIQ